MVPRIYSSTGPSIMPMPDIVSVRSLGKDGIIIYQCYSVRNYCAGARYK